MTILIPLIDAQQRNCSLRYSVDANSIFFTVTRFDGGRFSSPPESFNDAVSTSLESKFVEIVELFEGY